MVAQACLDALQQGSDERARMLKAQQAAFDAETEAVRPEVERWISTTFAKELQRQVQAGYTTIHLNPGGGGAAPLRDEVRVILGLPKSAFHDDMSDFSDRYIRIHAFRSPRGRVLIEGLLAAGITLKTSYRTIRSFADIPQYEMGQLTASWSLPSPTA